MTAQREISSKATTFSWSVLLAELILFFYVIFFFFPSPHKFIYAVGIFEDKL